MNQKGLAPILIIILIATLALGGYLVYQKYQVTHTPPQTTPYDPVACSQDAKLCPDGSYVSRVGPNCEFAPCPSTGSDISNWKTYTNTEYKITFKYPPSFLIAAEETISNAYGIFFARSEIEKQEVEECLKQYECYSIPFDISFKVISKLPNKTLNDVIWDDSRADSTNFSFTNIDNLPSLQEQITGVNESIVYHTYVDRDKTVFHIQIGKAKDLEINVDQILSTFRFLP